MQKLNTVCVCVSFPVQRCCDVSWLCCCVSCHTGVFEPWVRTLLHLGGMLGQWSSQVLRDQQLISWFCRAGTVTLCCTRATLCAATKQAVRELQYFFLVECVLTGKSAGVGRCAVKVCTVTAGGWPELLTQLGWKKNLLCCLALEVVGCLTQQWSVFGGQWPPGFIQMLG